MPNPKKSLEAILKDLKSQQSKLEQQIRELITARVERTRVVSAIRNVEHALKAIQSKGSSGAKAPTGRKKPGPKPGKARKKPGPKPGKARKKPGPKPGKKKTAKSNRSKAWTPAKRAAMARRVKAYWAKRKKDQNAAG